MKRQKKEKRKSVITKSLTFQISLVFGTIMALSFLICWMINSLFLERYYINNKEKTLDSIYDSICQAAENKTLESDEFGQELQHYSSNYNSSIVIITSLFEPVKIYANEPTDHLIRELQNNVLGWNKPETVLVKNDEYILTKQYDRYMGSDYIEMWGQIPNGGFFMLRTALESIRESADISNRFLLMVAIGSVFVTALIMFFFTRKFSKPILELADISNKMADMDFEARYEGKGSFEIETLGKNINYLSETLAEKITELKQANVELQKDLEQKEKINESGREFISNVSHELKTPIAIIQGYAEGLQEGVNEAEERDYYCEVIIDEAQKMNKMVRELLKLSELEIGNTELTITRFNVLDLIENFIQSSELMLKGNDIIVSVSSKEPIYVWADEFMIEEVFMNFFTNAMSHCSSDTQKRIEVSFDRMEDSVKVSVFNTGEHIPEEAIEHLWDKFYKVDKARTRAYGGSGVGLSIVKAVMEYHGQDYGVENVDSGVVFWFTLDTKE